MGGGGDADTGTMVAVNDRSDLHTDAQTVAYTTGIGDVTTEITVGALSGIVAFP